MQSSGRQLVSAQLTESQHCAMNMKKNATYGGNTTVIAICRRIHLQTLPDYSATPQIKALTRKRSVHMLSRLRREPSRVANEM